MLTQVLSPGKENIPRAISSQRSTAGLTIAARAFEAAWVPPESGNSGQVRSGKRSRIGGNGEVLVRPAWHGLILWSRDPRTRMKRLSLCAGQGGSAYNGPVFEVKNADFGQEPEALFASGKNQSSFRPGLVTLSAEHVRYPMPVIPRTSWLSRWMHGLKEDTIAARQRN
jgi:hypothetical protein